MAEPDADEQELPDDVADAWAAVLIDVYEKISERESTKTQDQQDRSESCPHGTSSASEI